MTLHDDIKRMGDLCRSCGDGGTRTIYSAGVELMRLFLEREAELLAMWERENSDGTLVYSIRWDTLMKDRNGYSFSVDSMPPIFGEEHDT